MLTFRREILELQGRRDGAVRVTIVRAGALGDTILVLPSVALLRSALPGSRLTLVGSAWAARLRPLIPFPISLADFDAPRLAPLFGGNPPGEGPPILRDADLVVIYTDSPDGPFVRNVRRLCRGAVIDWPVRPPEQIHAAAHYASALLTARPGLDELPLPKLTPSNEVIERVRQGPLSTGMESCPRWAAVHPGSGTPRKCWPAERFGALVNQLRRAGVGIVLIEGPADGELCRRSLAAAGVDGRGPFVHLRCPELDELAAILVLCGSYVGNDSGVTHLAGALGVCTVAIYGPTDPDVWKPLGKSIRIVRAGGMSGPRAGGWPRVSRVLKAVEDWSAA